MGFISWLTRKVGGKGGRSIPNRYSGCKLFPVWLLDNKGNAWCEGNYEGYGVFGGKDYFALLAQMNGLSSGDEDQDRTTGCNLSGKKGILYPNLVEDPKTQWVNEAPKQCMNQGMFY